MEFDAISIDQHLPKYNEQSIITVMIKHCFLLVETTLTILKKLTKLSINLITSYYLNLGFFFMLKINLQITFFPFTEIFIAVSHV